MFKIVITCIEIAAVVGILAVVASLLWPYVKKLLGMSASKTTTTVDTVMAFVDEAAFLTSLTPAYLLAKKRADSTILTLLGDCRVAAAKWDDAPDEAVIVSVTTPTLTKATLPDGTIVYIDASAVKAEAAK